MAGSPPSEAQTLRAVERLVADSLPQGWSLRSSAQGRPRSRVPDALWSLEAPDDSVATFALQVKRMLLGREIGDVLRQLAVFEALPLVAAPYLGPTIRSSLAERGVSFADTTGNLRIVADRPGLFIERHGASKDPWPSEDTLRSLRGRGAGRAVRALVDFRPPYGVRDLAMRAGVALGSLSRTLELLDREGLVSRDDRGSVAALDWEGTIRRWTQDYGFARSNQTASYLDPRGLGALAGRVAKTGLHYAATGAFAAQRFAPIAAARQAALYVENTEGVAERLGLRLADAGANVILAEGFDSVVLDRSTVREELRVVAASQLAADLLTGTGREPSEGSELLAWMRSNEDAWRA